MSYDPGARSKADAAASAAAQALMLSGAAQAALALQNWQVVNSNAIAADGSHLSVDTSVQPVTITAPLTGTSFALRDVAGTWGTHPVTVVGNGALIRGQPTFVLNAPGFVLHFTLAGGAWAYTQSYLHGVNG